MIKQVTINNKIYTVSDSDTYSAEEELIFEIRQDKQNVFVVGMWEDLLGSPVRKIWKIVGVSE